MTGQTLCRRMLWCCLALILALSFAPQHVQALSSRMLPRGDTGYIELCTNNCSFESGSMVGWNQSGGSFVVSSEFVRSGSYSVDGTGATNASFSQSFSLHPYEDWVDGGYGTVRGSAFIDPGKSERGIVDISFFDSSLTQIGGGWNSGEQYSPGTNWLQVANEIPIPRTARYVSIGITALRSGGDFTDMSVDDVTTQVRFVYPDSTLTPTKTLSPTQTNSRTRTATRTSLPTRTTSPTRSRTATRTASRTPTLSRTATNAPSATLTSTPSRTMSVTSTRTVTPTKTRTLPPSVTSTPTLSPVPSLCQQRAAEWDICGYYVARVRLEALIKNVSFATRIIRITLGRGMYAQLCEVATNECVWESESVREPVNPGLYSICFTSSWRDGCGFLPTLGTPALYSAYFVTDVSILGNLGYRFTIR